MPLNTRPPTGVPSWPIVLITGRDKVGKSWQIAEASSSDLVGRTLWLPVGELDPDEYGAVDGARFEIVLHDGTIEGILEQLAEAVVEPADGKPNLLAVDGAGTFWKMLTDWGQGVTEARARARFGGELPDFPIEIANDVWRRIHTQWGQFMSLLRMHQGPVILTARLDSFTIAGGEGAADRTVDKVKAEKGLPYDVDAVIELPARGEAWLTGVRSVALQLNARERRDDITIDALWRLIGVDKKVGNRQHTELRPTASIQQEVAA